jgi:hypothetical protein
MVAATRRLAAAAAAARYCLSFWFGALSVVVVEVELLRSLTTMTLKRNDCSSFLKTSRSIYFVIVVAPRCLK